MLLSDVFGALITSIIIFDNSETLKSERLYKHICVAQGSLYLPALSFDLGALCLELINLNLCQTL